MESGGILPSGEPGAVDEEFGLVEDENGMTTILGADGKP